MNRLPGAIAAFIVLSAISAMPASAASTRAEYVAQVDPICRSSADEVRETLRAHGLKPVLYLEDLRSGSRKDQLRVAKLLALTIKLDRQFVDQIAAVAPPPGDEATIAGWVAHLRSYVSAEAKAVHAVRADKAQRAYKLLVRSLRPLIRDNEALKPFGFQHCTF